MTAWQLHPTEPNTWQVFAPWGQCIAVIRPEAGSEHWEGVIRPRPDQLYPGVRITSYPSREAGIAVIARELAVHWPEAANRPHQFDFACGTGDFLLSNPPLAGGGDE